MESHCEIVDSLIKAEGSAWAGPPRWSLFIILNFSDAKQFAGSGLVIAAPDLVECIMSIVNHIGAIDIPAEAYANDKLQPSIYGTASAEPGRFIRIDDKTERASHGGFPGRQLF